MKKNFLVLASAISLMFSACDKGEDDNNLIVDWSPIELRFFVVDYGQRTNYVADNYNDIIHTTTLTYRGKTYSVGQTLSKYYMPDFKGFYVDSTALEKPFFCFGELDGAENYDDDFIITFADGTSDTVHFKRVHKGVKDVKDTWILNGKERSRGEFILYRQEQDGKLINLHLDWE
ncbi:MAG: hypothetical protein II956_12085 [Bacteroidales bacterium]|nr:hypothetical protein [Bacteroidales bacterium]